MTDTMTRPNTARPDLGQHLAIAASLLRDLAGGAHWDVPGIRAEIHRAKHLAPPAELAHAVIAWCTTRLDLTAPQFLADEGPHWHTGRTPNTKVTRVRCTQPGHEYEDAVTCRLCPVERYEPTDAPTLGVISDAQKAINARGLALVLAVTPPARQLDHAERAAGTREDD